MIRGKEVRRKAEGRIGVMEVSTFVHLFVYFAIFGVFLQNCDFMGSYFLEDIHYDVQRSESIGNGANGVAFKISTKASKQRLVVKEVRSFFFFAVRESTNFC